MAQPSAQPPPPDRRAQLIAAALAVATAAGVAGAAGAPAAGLTSYLGLNAATLAALTKLFVGWRYDRRTIRFMLRTVVRITTTTHPPTLPGPAEMANRRAEAAFAAWFLERATARVEARLQDPNRRPSTNDGSAAGDAGEDDAYAPEDRFIDQHLDAQRRRWEAAQAVDKVALEPDQVTTEEEPDEDGMGRRRRVILRWRAHPDDKVTPECRAADGAWFYADTPPIIGYPGMPHGGTCRCWPANAGSLEEVARGRSVDEAVRDIISREDQHRDHPGSGDDQGDERETA